MLVNQRTEEVFVPLNSLSHVNKLELANSSLSEMAILGVSDQIFNFPRYSVYRLSSSME